MTSCNEERAAPFTASVKYSNVPDAEPGPNNCISRFGPPTALKLRTPEPGSQMRRSCATVSELSGFEG